MSQRSEQSYKRRVPELLGPLSVNGRPREWHWRGGKATGRLTAHQLEFWEGRQNA